MPANWPAVVLVSCCFGLLALQGARADEVRRTAFPATLIGTWGESADLCAAKDKSNVVIEDSRYGDGAGICTVRWIIETPGQRGTNYAVHALCTSAKDSSKTELVNIVVRPTGPDQAIMGRSFDDLHTFQRCPAN